MLTTNDEGLSRRPLAYPVAELPAETGVQRTSIYEEIRKGALVTFKVGRKRFATYEAVKDWIHRLEEQTRRGVA